VTGEAEIGEVKAPTGGRSNHQGNNEQEENINDSVAVILMLFFKSVDLK
jgi:hypothetical protein